MNKLGACTKKSAKPIRSRTKKGGWGGKNLPGGIKAELTAKWEKNKKAKKKM